MENQIIELKQSDSNASYANGDWNTKLAKPITILEGDQITITKAFLDTEDQSDGKVNIEYDINIQMDIMPYLTNWATIAGGTYSTPSLQNDGFDYYMCNSTAVNNPKLAGFQIINTIRLVMARPDLAPENWGNFVGQIQHKSLDLDGNPTTATAYIAVPPLTLRQDGHGDPVSGNGSTFYDVTGLSILAKAGFNPDSTHSGYFKVLNPQDFLRTFTDTDIEVTASTLPTTETITPLIFKKNIVIREGRYEPLELCEKINNACGEQENVEERFPLVGAMDSPFIKDSFICRETTKVFTKYIEGIQFNTTNKDFIIKQAKPHAYINNQTLTLTNFTSVSIGGIAMNALNGLTFVVKAWTENGLNADGTPDTEHPYHLTLTLPANIAQPNDSTNPGRQLTQPIEYLEFRTGEAKVYVYYKYHNPGGQFPNNQVQLSNYSGTLLPNGTQTVVGINFVTNIIGQVLTIDPALSDEANKLLVLDIASTATGNFQLYSTWDDEENVIVIYLPVGPGNSTVPQINTTESTSDLRPLVRTDGDVIWTVPNGGTNGTDGQAGSSTARMWIGASQVQLDFDDQTNLFQWKNLHMPIMNSGTILSKLVKDSTEPPPTNAFFWGTKNGGCSFQNLSATRVDTGEIYDFWRKKLGFVISEETISGIKKPGCCVGFSTQFKTLANGESYHIPVFTNVGDGITAVSQRPTADSLVDKDISNEEDFRHPAKDPTSLNSESTLTIPIVAAEIALSSQLLRFGYFYIELIAGFQSELVSELSIQQNIHSIVNRYYSLGSFTSSEGSSINYIHRGEPLFLSDFKVRILDSDKNLSVELGEDNTIFLEIIRGELALQPYVAPPPPKPIKTQKS